MIWLKSAKTDQRRDFIEFLEKYMEEPRRFTVHLGVWTCTFNTRLGLVGDDAPSAKGVIAMRKFIAKFFSDESGATAIEYGLIAALISVAIIGAVTSVGTNLTNTFNSVATAL
jgi:pilus assembly protein Flp/PilA